MKHDVTPQGSARVLTALHAIPSIALHHGGPSQSVAGLINAMSRHAPGRVELICGRDQQEPELGAHVNRHDVRYLNRRFWCPTPVAIGRMAQAVRGADVVHVHSYWNGFASTIIALAQRDGKPVVLSPRGSLQERAMAQSSSRAKAVLSALGGRRQLAGVSGFHFQTRVEAQASFGAWGRLSVIIDNGVEIPWLDTPQTSLRSRLFGQAVREKNLVFLGRIARIKGIDLQIRALGLLKGRGVAARLHLVGPDGGDQMRLQNLACDLSIADRVHFHGPVYSSAKQQWLQAADAVLMSSEFENNSNAALEAMAAGGILIGTEGTISDGPVLAGAAIRVPRMAEALALAISQPSDPAIREKAHSYVQAHHGWAPRAVRMLEFYESLL